MQARGAELSSQNFFSIACPNKACFLPVNGHLKILGGLQPAAPYRPLPRMPIQWRIQGGAESAAAPLFFGRFLSFPGAASRNLDSRPPLFTDSGSASAIDTVILQFDLLFPLLSGRALVYKSMAYCLILQVLL